MINDKTLDEALIEIMRCKKALEALQAKRKWSEQHQDVGGMPWYHYDQVKEHAAAKRASLDLTRKLADLRAGR
jgi:hypothetical protein